MRAPTSYNVIQKRLVKQSGGDFAIPDGTPEEEVQRAPPGYGVFASGYSGALAQQAQDPYFGGAYMSRLQHLTDEERANVAATTDADRMAGFYGKVIPEIIKKADATTGQLGEFDTSAMGPYGQIFNPVTIGANQAIAQNGRIAEGHKTTAEGMKAAREAGVTIDEPTVESSFGNPVFGTPATGYGVFAGNRTPDEEAKLTTANASMKKADADMIDANNPNKYNRKSGGSGSDGVATSIIVPVPGVGMMTVKGKNGAAVMEAARGATGRAEAPKVGQLRSLAERKGWSVVDEQGGGVSLSNGRVKQTYNAQGNRIR